MFLILPQLVQNQQKMLPSTSFRETQSRTYLRAHQSWFARDPIITLMEQNTKSEIHRLCTHLVDSSTSFDLTECCTDTKLTRVCRQPGESSSKEPRRLQCAPLLPPSSASPAPGKIPEGLLGPKDLLELLHGLHHKPPTPSARRRFSGFACALLLSCSKTPPWMLTRLVLPASYEMLKPNSRLKNTHGHPCFGPNQ